MSTITAILEADADGSLHLPLPEELRHGKVRVTATLLPVADEIPTAGRGFGALKGKISMTDFDESLDGFSASPEMLEKRSKAFERLRELNPFRDIADPVAWQREIRTDRPLPDRD